MQSVMMIAHDKAKNILKH